MKLRFHWLMSLLAILAISCVAFSSCSKDDDDLDNVEQSNTSDNETLDSRLIGTWLYSYTDTYGGTTRIERTFYKNGSGTVHDYYTDKNGTVSDEIYDSGTWETSSGTLGGTLYWKWSGSSDTSKLIYTISGNTLYLNSSKYQRTN